MRWTPLCFEVCCVLATFLGVFYFCSAPDLHHFDLDLEWMCKFRSTAVSLSIVAFLSSPMLSLMSPTVLILLVSALVIYVVRLLLDFTSSIQEIEYVLVLYSFRVYWAISPKELSRAQVSPLSHLHLCCRLSFACSIRRDGVKIPMDRQAWRWERSLMEG